MLLRSLVVYYSKTGNTKWAAQTIAAEVGADAEELAELKKRPGVVGFLKGVSSHWANYQTQIAPTTRSPGDYDLVIIGTPVWGGKPTPAITVYLKNADLAGMKVALFFTQDSKKPQAIEEAKALIPNSMYLGSLSLVNPLNDKEACEKQIMEWCAKLNSHSSPSAATFL